MVEYKWEILSLYVVPHENGLDNIIESVNWRFQAREDSSFGDVYDVTVLPRPSSDKYKVYKDLDEETIIGWVKDQIDYDALVKRAEEKLAEDKAPAIVEKEPPFQKTNKYNGDEEYLIVFDNDPEKVWGPMRWNSKRANNGLKENGISDYEFPFDITMYQKELLPIDSPQEVTEGVTLYRVEYTEQPEFDEIYQYNDGLQWALDSGKAVGTYHVHDRSLDDIKDILIDKVVRQSEEKQNEGSISIDHNGNSYAANASLEFRSLLSATKNAIPASGTVVVRLHNNEYIEVTEEELDEIIVNVEAEHQKVLNEEKSLVSNIRSANTVDELKSLGVE